MSTLGTFSKYADFNFYDDLSKGFNKVKKRITKSGAAGNKRVNSLVNSARRAVEPGYKAKEDLAKNIRTRNILVGSGLGLSGAGALGGIALSKRKKKNVDMSAQSDNASFAKKTYGDVTDAMRVGGASLSADQLAKIKAVKDSKKKLDADQLKAVKEKADKYKGQRVLEKATDTGSTVAPKTGFMSRTTALAGSPERDLIRSGKLSDNKFVKSASEGAEKFGKMGFKQGATGARGVLNNVVGRSVTGKAVRLGAAGVGIAAIGSALRKKREAQY